MAKFTKVQNGLYHLVRYQDFEEKEWGMANAMVIRASCADTARVIASENCGDEGAEVWLDKKLSSCRLLKPNGPKGLICLDFHEA